MVKGCYFLVLCPILNRRWQQWAVFAHQQCSSTVMLSMAENHCGPRRQIQENDCACTTVCCLVYQLTNLKWWLNKVFSHTQDGLELGFMNYYYYKLLFLLLLFLLNCTLLDTIQQGETGFRSTIFLVCMVCTVDP